MFTEADPLRHGRVHRDRFTRGLAQLVPSLRTPELEAIAERFSQGVDVDWRRFAAEVDSEADRGGMLNGWAESAWEWE